MLGSEKDLLIDNTNLTSIRSNSDFSSTAFCNRDDTFFLSLGPSTVLRAKVGFGDQEGLLSVPEISWVGLARFGLIEVRSTTSVALLPALRGRFLGGVYKAVIIY